LRRLREEGLIVEKDQTIWLCDDGSQSHEPTSGTLAEPATVRSGSPTEPSHEPRSRKLAEPATTRSGSLVELEIALLHTGPAEMARAQLYVATVDEYARRMADGEVFTPPLVYKDEAGVYWLVDGRHTTEGAKKNGQLTIVCTVRPGTESEAIYHALHANDTHGRQPTNADRRAAAMVMLTHPDWHHMADREISRHVGLSHTTIAKLRKAGNGCQLRATTNRRRAKVGGGDAVMTTLAWIIEKLAAFRELLEPHAHDGALARLDGLLENIKQLRSELQMGDSHQMMTIVGSDAEPVAGPDVEVQASPVEIEDRATHQERGQAR
jgi:hypothetical protein